MHLAICMSRRPSFIGADLRMAGRYISAELGARQFVAQGLAEMGQSLRALGNDIEAKRIWSESLRIATDYSLH